MAAINNIKLLKGSGQNLTDAPEYIATEDFTNAYNLRFTGTALSEGGYASNPESTQLITQSLPAGINKGIGGGSFEDVDYLIFPRFNSAGNNQIVKYDNATKTETVLYTDITDSNGLQLLPWNPQNYVKFILVNETYLIWVATGNEVGYCNINTLSSGGYGTVLPEDLSLLKPQILIPPTGLYGSDPGQAANYWYGELPVFSVQIVNADFNYSAWSAHSKRIVPYQQNTPTLGQDVTQNNYIIISVNIGSIRTNVINIARLRNNETVFSIIKSVNYSDVIALTNTAVNVATLVYEAYDPSTNLYSFVSYGNEVAIPVDPDETDLSYDYIWPANTVGLLNGNIVALADLLVGYQRPATPVTIGAVAYNPNIGIPAGTFTNSLQAVSSGSGNINPFNQTYTMVIRLGGVPALSDVVIVTTADIRNAQATLPYVNYPVPSGQVGNLAAVVNSVAEQLPASSYKLNTDGTYSIIFTGQPFYKLQTFSVTLSFPGATVANSIPTILDNTTIQYALSYRDGSATTVGGRFFPLCTGNSFIVNTPSYAQVNGQAINVAWQIDNATAPVGAVDYQWLTTKPPVDSLIEIIAGLLNYKGVWDAHTNTPTLAVNVGTVGDVYQITTPSLPTDTTFFNLGTGGPYNTGDYLYYNGQAWTILPKSFGDLTSTGNILAFNLNALNLYTSQYSDQGVSTVLSYDFSPGDRCTLHYWIDGSGNKNYFNLPCVNLSVLGYDRGNYIVKVENSAAFTYASGHIYYNGNQIDVSNIFLRLYSPVQVPQAVSTTLNGTVWYEIGERFPIVNGLHTVLQGTIYEGGAYYKTRTYLDALNPYASSPIPVIATDLNYSDFYVSPYNSINGGRPRSFNDELLKTERKAITITGQQYILGSMVNGLTRFFPADTYGEVDGQTSSSFGAIQELWQRGDILLIIQELNIFYAPVNYAYIQLNTEQTSTAISEKLLNNGRYETKNRGLGVAKEAFCFNENWAWMVDPNYSDVFEISVGGVSSIGGKMTKYLKQVLALAYSQGYKIVLFYNRYYDELMVCIETLGGVLTLFSFNGSDWNPNNNYAIVPSNIVSITTPANGTVSYNSSTGVATYTPNTGFVGNNTSIVTFNPGTGNISINVCLNWTAGDTTVNPFSFTPVTGQPLSTVIPSINTISVSGPNIAVPVSISGASGQYNINGGAWTSAAGTTVAGDVIRVRQTSSGSNSTLTVTTLTIGTQSGAFDVTTYASAPAASISINNTTIDFTIAYVDVLSGGILVYNKTNISPGGSIFASLAAGTYTVNVKVLSSTDGGTGVLTIDSAGTPTTYPVPAFGTTQTQTGVMTSIIVEIDP